MKPWIFAALLICTAAFTNPLTAQDAQVAAPDPARMAAARELMEVTGVTKQMDGMVDAMSKGFAKGAKSSAEGQKAAGAFDDMMKRFLGYKQDMLRDFEVLYAESFTAEEMNAVSNFYRSGAGAKFVAMTPELMQKGAAIGIKYSERMMKDAQSGNAP